MTDKELRKLRREDLLEMLVNQSREVKELKQERDTLISQVRHFKGEFDKVGSLDAILSRLGVPAGSAQTTGQISSMEALLRQFEEEDTTMELFDAEAPQTSSDEKQEDGALNKRMSSVRDRIKASIKNNAEKYEAGVIEKAEETRTKVRSDDIDEFERSELTDDENDRSAFSHSSPEIAQTESPDSQWDDEDFIVGLERNAAVSELSADDLDHDRYDEESGRVTSKRKKPDKSKPKQNRVHEAIAWAKIRFGDKK